MDTNIIRLYEKTIPSGSPHAIPLSIFCEVFQINQKQQVRMLQLHPGLRKHLISIANPDLYNDNRTRYHLTRSGFIWWVLQLDSKRIPEPFRSDFLDYQESLMDYLLDSLPRQEKLLEKVKLRNEIHQLYTKLRENELFLEWQDKQASLMRNEKELKELDQHVIEAQLKINFE